MLSKFGQNDILNFCQPYIECASDLIVGILASDWEPSGFLGSSRDFSGSLGISRDPSRFLGISREVIPKVIPKRS